MSALMSFKSHIAGKNADVTIYPDRIEWEQQGRITATRALGGALLTGSLRKGGASEMIPIRSLTSVTTSKDGLTNYKVTLIAPGNTIEMRVPKGVAEQVKSTVTGLMLA